MNTIDKFNDFINNTPISLIYFSSTNCSVCDILKPKILSLVSNYTIIDAIEIKAHNNIELCSQLNLFTFPTILLFIDGKEVLRESKYISVLELKDKLDRYYNLYT